MKLTKVDEDGRWWAGQKTDWCVQDRSGNWWIFKHKEVKTKIPKRKRLSKSNVMSIKEYTVIILASLLGVSLAFNLINLIFLFKIL
jgi:hypothetical protein